MALRVAYADPPYPGCAHLYADHPVYAGAIPESANRQNPSAPASRGAEGGDAK